MLNIANPIYDVVFKYLMDDNKVAKKLLSLIIGHKIISLEMKPTEMRGTLANRGISILHIDFAALVDFEKEGCKQVIIELQKAKYHADIMRFRKYLGTQYADPNNAIIKQYETKDKIINRKHAIPILSIYFLGYPLDKIKEPVIKIERQYISAATDEKINEKEEFIESLTHDSIIIQIPYLKLSRRTKLEQVLSVFESSTKQIVDIEEAEYPAEYKEVLQRLLAAAAEPEVRQNMEIEEEYLAELSEYERELMQKEQLLEEKEQVIEEKEQVIEEKEQVIEEKEQLLEKKDLEIKNLEEQAKKLQSAVELLAEKLDISLEEAKRMLKS